MKLVVSLGLILCSEAHLGFEVVFRGVLSQAGPGLARSINGLWV